MATLKLPEGKKYTIKHVDKRVVLAPVRSGHSASSIRFDPYRSKNRAKSRPEDVPIARKNTPLGKAPIPARWSAKKSQAWEPSNEAQAAFALPADIIEQTICNIKRKDLGLRHEKVARAYPVVDPSRLKPVKERDRVSQIEKGMSPHRKAALRLLRKAGII